MSVSDRMLKWLGMMTLIFGILPLTAIVLRDLPGAVREVKGLKMGHRGGWHQAH